MAETLYRKYRPQTFADVTEQTHVIRTITNQLAAGTVAHAYLFSGPRGVGKTTIARLLAKAVNCEGRKAGEFEPCNHCGPCVEFQDGRFIDTIEMDAASHTGVDNVRENIIENVRFVPQRGTYKVFIIDEVHMLSTSAFNALLKTLEEPPEHALFVLATTELHKIPATIISRCQRFDFHRIPALEMIARLKGLTAKEGVAVADEVLASIARLSEGCLRDAESLLGQVLAIGGKQITADDASVVLPATNIVLVTDIVDRVAANELPVALQLLAGFVDNGGPIRQLVDEMIEFVRDQLFAALRGETAKFTASEARRLLDLLLQARNRQSLSLLPQLPLELALAEFMLGSAPAAASASPKVPLPSPQPMQRGDTPSIAPREQKPASAEKTAVQSTNIAPKDKVSFTVQDLQDKWERCCVYVADRNVALPLVLQSAKPVEVEGNVVTISCAFSFHAEALDEGKNKRLIEEAIGSVMMEPVIVKLRVDAHKQDDAAAELAAAFGGSVVG